MIAIWSSVTNQQSSPVAFATCSYGSCSNFPARGTNHSTLTVAQGSTTMATVPPGTGGAPSCGVSGGGIETLSGMAASCASIDTSTRSEFESEAFSN